MGELLIVNQDIYICKFSLHRISVWNIMQYAGRIHCMSRLLSVLCEVCFFLRASDLFTQAVDHVSACSSVREDRRFCCSSWKSAEEAQASLLFWTQQSLHEAWETDPVPHTKETLIQGWVKQMLWLYIIEIYWLFFWCLTSRELPWKKKKRKEKLDYLLCKLNNHPLWVTNPTHESWSPK